LVLAANSVEVTGPVSFNELKRSSLCPRYKVRQLIAEFVSLKMRSASWSTFCCFIQGNCCITNIKIDGVIEPYKNKFILIKK
jgi:hypothetical protein